MADSLAFTAIDELSIQKLNDTHETDAVKRCDQTPPPPPPPPSP